MKKWFFSVWVFSMVLSAQVMAQGFTIDGKLDGFPEGTDIVMYKNGESVEMARTKLVKEKFILSGTIKEPVLCYLIIGKQKPLEVYLENSKISVKGDNKQPDVYKIEGSASHKEFSAFLTDFLPISGQLSSLANTINNTAAGAERDKLTVLYNKAQDNVQVAIDNFVKNYPKSFVSAFILSATFGFKEDALVLENRFKLLDTKIRNSETGKQLELFIAESKVGAVGSEAMEFSQPDTTGKSIALSSFRGKYVLIDFWASWCKPCRLENPNVVENFNKFSKKNFTVLGVSLDRPGQKESWISAIHEDKLTWTHVSDLQFWNNAAALLYKVKGIPQNFLVDPKGKIVAKNLRGADLGSKLCELLGCETAEVKTN